MSKRIVTPIDQAAFAKAQQDFAKKHPHVATPTPGTKEHRKLREEWLKLYEKAGGRVDSGKTFQAKIGGGAVEPCPLKNVIATVEFLESPTTVLAADAKQHVNLPKEQKHVDGVRVTGAYRLGRKLGVRVTFRRPKKEKFKVALLAHSGNATYSVQEQAARPTYQCPRAPAAPEHVQGSFDQYQGNVHTGETKSTGIAVVENAFEIPVSGGDKYTLVAWDVNGNVVFATYKITTTRTLYYATFLCDDPNDVRVDQDWFRGELERTYAAQRIELVWVGAQNLNGITYHDIVWETNVGNAVLNLARTANSSLGRTLDADKPFVLKFVFVDHIADQMKKKIQPVRVNDRSPGDVIDIPLFTATPQQRQRDVAFDWRKCVWRGLGQAVDVGLRPASGHEWFHGAKVTLHLGTGDQILNPAPVATDFTLVPRAVGTPDAICELQYTVPNSVPAHTDITVEVEALIVNRSVMGQSLQRNFAGITLQPARSHFVPISDNKQLASAIHECGHAMGMVATVAQQGLTHDRHYDWQGNHCWTSVAGPAAQPEDYHKIPLKDTGTCVMYGLIPDGAPNMDFCAKCGPMLRKLDLTKGFTG